MLHICHGRVRVRVRIRDQVNVMTCKSSPILTVVYTAVVTSVVNITTAGCNGYSYDDPGYRCSLMVLWPPLTLPSLRA